MRRTGIATSHKPVRRVVRRGHLTNVGWFPSIKMGRSIGYESPLERQFLTLMEADPSVTAVFEQPERLRWKDGTTWRTHVPDFLIIQDEKEKIREVKSRSDALAFEQRTSWLKREQSRLGRSYEVICEDTILAQPAFYNAELLVNARRNIPSATLSSLIVQYIKKADIHPSIAQIRTHFSDHQLNANNIYALILTGKLAIANPLQWLSPETIIRVRP